MGNSIQYELLVDEGEWLRNKLVVWGEPCLQKGSQRRSLWGDWNAGERVERFELEEIAHCYVSRVILLFGFGNGLAELFDDVVL